MRTRFRFRIAAAPSETGGRFEIFGAPRRRTNRDGWPRDAASLDGTGQSDGAGFPLGAVASAAPIHTPKCTLSLYQGSRIGDRTSSDRDPKAGPEPPTPRISTRSAPFSWTFCTVPPLPRPRCRKPS